MELDSAASVPEEISTVARRSKQSVKRRMILHQCPHCLYSSNKHINLKRHILTHTGEKPFLCQKCGQGFAQSTHLSNHMRRAHPATNKDISGRPTRRTRSIYATKISRHDNRTQRGDSEHMVMEEEVLTKERQEETNNEDCQENVKEDISVRTCIVLLSVLCII